MSRYPGGIITKSPATPSGPNPTGRAPGVWKLNDVAYWIKQGVWPDASADVYWPYTTLLLSTTSLGNANNNLFVDSSGAFNPISRNGNTTQGSFTPYGASWSNYFDGSGDYLQTTAINISSGDFTVEAWVYLNAMPTSDSWPGSYSNWMVIVDVGSASLGDGWQFRIGQTVLAFGTNNDTTAVSATHSMVVGQWYHLAVTRSGNVYTLYRNGTSIGSATYTANSPGTGAFTWIGTETNQGAYLNGYVSNARVVAGTAVYTGNFTPSTTPLTAVSGTVLLTCQSNRFRDASTNNYAITSGGDVRVTEFSPFAPAYPGISYNQSDIQYWSGYFDGSGDYLSVPNSSANNLGTSDFTIELWFKSDTGTMNTHACLVASYSSPVSGSWAFKAQSGTSGYIQFASYGPSWNDWVTTTNIAADKAWHHCAVTRSGNTLRIFVDGAVKGTWDISGASSFTGGGHPLTTGFMAQDSTSYLNGNVSNVRIVKGTALYTSAFTPPTSPLTAISGTVYLTCQNAAFTDNSTNNFAITQNGNLTVTGNSPFNPTGYWSGYFDGSGDYLTISDSTPLNLAGGTFTLEAWIYPNGNYSDYRTIITKRILNSSTTSYQLYLRITTGYLCFFNGTEYVSSVTPNANSWNHVAAVYDGTNINLYLNGVRVLQSAVTITNQSADLYIGSFPSYGENVVGYLSNVRILKGVQAYSGATYTVPTSPLTAISGTSLLTCQNGRFIDNSSNAATVTVTGNTNPQPYNPFYTSTIASNGGSMYLDGAGDYLTSPTNINYDFASSNFTIEGWFYFTNSTANALQTLFSNYTNFSAAGSIFWGKHTSASGYMTVWFSNYSTGGPLLAETSYPPNNSWVHYALVRNGNTFTLYRNGVSTASATWSGAATSGACPAFIGAAGDAVTSYNFPGYMNGFRITKGTAVYTTSFTPPTAPLTPSANTTLLLNGMNAGAYDATGINDMETVGDAKVSTAVSKFGGSSMYFDGSGDYLTTQSSAALSLGSGDFTFEAWIYPTGVSGTDSVIFDFRSGNSGNNGPIMIIGAGSGNPLVYVAAGSAQITGSGITLNTWSHVAVSRSGTSTKMFLNGTQTGSTYTDTNSYTNPARIYLGADDDGSPNAYFIGYMDDVRITKGVARYTSNFTPPTQAFPTY